MSSNRPLSPHLQIYRPQITTVLSITHRAAGAALAFGAIFAAWWLLSVVNGAGSYAVFYHFAKSFVGRFMLFGWLWAFCYHFLNGIRHLVWDAGRGLDMKTAAKSGWAVVAGSVVLTVFFWGAGMKNGTGHWWMQRVTSVILIPLALYILFHLKIFLPDPDALGGLVAAIRTPALSAALILSIVAAFYHGWLGVQVIVEDYVHGEGTRSACLLASALFFFLLGAACLLSVLYLDFGR